MPGRPMEDSPLGDSFDEVCDDPSTSLTVSCPLVFDDLDGDSPEEIAALLCLSSVTPVEQTDSGLSGGGESHAEPIVYAQAASDCCVYA